MSERLLTVEEFAAATRQHKETIRRQIRRGAIATIRTGRKHLIPESLATIPATETQRKSAEAPASAPTAPSGTAPNMDANTNPAAFIGVHLPPVEPLDLAALFAPPTPEETARRLAALDALGRGIDDEQDDGEELDLSGDRATLYGYEERDVDPTAGVRFDRDERDRRIMEAGL